MRSLSAHRGVTMIGPLLVAAAWVCLAATTARAQAKPAPAKAAGVFDDDKRDSAAKSSAAPKKDAVTDRDKLGFTQDNVAAQMGELEERMFRLSEALRGLEPENASRLRLALKFSREEQILEQMRESHKLLKDAQLAKAETEVRELLAKLEHLRDLLLAEDLDFQLKLARLRQMRETLAQLERILKEERRALGWSRSAIEQAKRRERLLARRPDLDSLRREQEALLAATKDAAEDVRAALSERQSKLRKTTNALADDPLFADQQPAHLRKADSHMGDALGALEEPDVDAAAAAEGRALGMIREELARLDDQVAQAERTVAKAEFSRRAGEQAKNRLATDTLAELSARLGDAGVALRKDLIRASALMQSAEQVLVKGAAENASSHEASALEVLTKSSGELGLAVERLLVELRRELQAKLVAELIEMHDMQATIRETTQAQAPRVQQKSRTALILVNGLSKKEAELATRIEHGLALVEETEFGIALPTALRVFGRELHSVEGWLKEGDVASRTIALETRLEEDLLAVLQSVRRLPPTTPPPPGPPLPTDARERERELNRLIAELKIVRLLQVRLNDDTVGVDKSRPQSPALPPALRREVEVLEAGQDEIRDSLAKIAERVETSDDNP